MRLMRLLGNPLFLLCLLSVGASAVSDAQQVARQDTSAAAQGKRSGTWSARNNSGTSFTGTWTAVLDAKNGTVTGTWTLIDAQGKTLIGGGWSAAKAPTQWNGAWRAIVTGSNGEYSGTWTAGVDLKADALLDDLFEKAVRDVVSGTWRAGTKSGAWAIRTCCEGRP